MDKQEKSENQNAFIRGDVQIMVATSAFGMGVDKKDVGLVINFDISDSLENYVQEAGRAGRDETIAAECYVLYHEEDLNKHFILLNQTKLSIREIQQIWKAIKEITRFRSTVSNSALEIARKAGWDDQVVEIETRVKTAIAVMEQSGYLKRKHNEYRVFANSIRLKTAQEAIDIITHSSKIASHQKMNAIRIIKKLFSSKRRKMDSEEQLESRIDYLSDHLGINRQEVIDIITVMREEQILTDYKDLSAFIKKGKHKSRSIQLVHQFLQLEEYYANERVIKDKLENTPNFFAKVVNEFPKINKVWNEEKKQFVYSTHWDHLANHALNVSRITLDHQEVISTEEIFNEYNRRNLLVGENPVGSLDEFIVRAPGKVHSVQHGYWKYFKEKIEKIDVREVINQFILDQKGVVYFKDVIAHVIALKYKYPDNSIRAYIQNFARKSANDPNLFVHEDYIESSGIEVFNKRNNLIGKELIPIFHDILKKLKYDFPNNEFYQLIFNECESRNVVLNNKNIVYAYLDRFYKLGILNINEGSIIASSINKEKLATYEYRPEPNYRKHIRNEAIALLKETGNNRIRIKEMYDQLFHLFPKEVSKTNFYRIFSESDLFSTHEYKGKLYYQLEEDQLPDAKPFIEEVFELEDTIIVDINPQIVEQIEASVTLEINDEVTIPETSTNYNFGFQLNSQQIFDFIFNELGRKYKNAQWFNDGFDDFKKIIGSQSNYDQHWGAKILNLLAVSWLIFQIFMSVILVFSV